MSVPDVSAAAAKVAAAGGRSLVAPRQVGSIGRAAVVVDPQGAPVGLLRRAGGDPADEPSPSSAASSGWSTWPRTRRPLLAFYKGLAGYESQARETPAGPYQVLTLGRPRAGLMKIPIENVRPNWLSYVRVEDPAALAGRVVVAGRQGRAGARGPTFATARWPSWPIPAAPSSPCRSGRSRDGEGDSDELPVFRCVSPGSVLALSPRRRLHGL